MWVDALGARNDLTKLRDVTISRAVSLGSTPTPPTCAQPTGQESHSEGQSGARGQVPKRECGIASNYCYWSGGPPSRQRGLIRLGQQRFSPRPEGLHHVVASLAVGRRAAPVARGQVRATLAASPTAAKLATIDDPP